MKGKACSGLNNTIRVILIPVESLSASDRDTRADYGTYTVGKLLPEKLDSSTGLFDICTQP
jgi:hypothetical protein